MMSKFEDLGGPSGLDGSQLSSSFQNDQLLNVILEDQFATEKDSDNGAVNYGALEAALNSLMSQVTSKEILYEPLKDLEANYPKFLKNAKETEKQGFEEQYQKIQKCIQIFESPEYDARKDADIISKLVEEIQEKPLPAPLIDNSMETAGCPTQ